MVATRLVVDQAELELSEADLAPLNVWLPLDVRQRVFGGSIPKGTEMIRLSREDLAWLCAGLRWVVDTKQVPTYWDATTKTLHTVDELRERLVALSDGLSRAA